MTSFSITSGLSEDVTKLQTEVSDITLSAGASSFSDPDSSKFGISLGDTPYSLNSVCLGNLTDVLHPSPDIVAKPEFRAVTDTSVRNALCAGKFITMIAEKEIINGQVLSGAVDSDGNVLCTPCFGGDERDKASTVLGIALEAGNEGDPINVAVSGFCTGIGLVPTGGSINPGSYAPVVYQGGPTAGTIYGNIQATGALATCGMLLQSRASSATNPTAPWEYLLKITVGHEAY